MSNLPKTRLIHEVIADQNDVIATKANVTDLSAVATSGSYNDLDDKPTIPSALSDLSDDPTHRLVTDTEKSTWNSNSGSSSNSYIPSGW